MDLRIKTVNLPDFGKAEKLPSVSESIYAERCNRLYEVAKQDWIFIYADREHFGNLYYLSAFDPRFEEAALVLGPNNKKILLVGNEGLDYSVDVKLEDVEVRLVQSFSLLGQDRTVNPRLDIVLKDIGIDKGNKVGVVGWKYLEETELITGYDNYFIPSFVISSIESLTGTKPNDITDLLLSSQYGLRLKNGIEELARLEFGATRASESVINIINNSDVGITEYEAVSAMNYEGDPLQAHVMFDSDSTEIVGLRSPTSKNLNEGDAVTTAIGYWGGLSCRAGVLSKASEEYFNTYAKHYFKAIVKWYENVDIGSKGSDIYNMINDCLAEGGLKPALNPGHLTSIDEWLHTTVRPESDDVIKSGMAIQLDIIPAGLPKNVYLNCEDSVFFADKEMREEIRRQQPKLWDRITARKKFMSEELGIRVSENLLPLSNTPGYFPPFWLDANKVIVKER